MAMRRHQLNYKAVCGFGPWHDFLLPKTTTLRVPGISLTREAGKGGEQAAKKGVAGEKR